MFCICTYVHILCLHAGTLDIYIHNTPDMRSLEPGNDGYTSQSSDRRGNSHSSPLEQRQLLDSARFGIPSGLLSRGKGTQTFRVKNVGQKHKQKTVVLWSAKVPTVGEWIFCEQLRARICKRLRSPGIHFKKSIPPACVVWRAGRTTLFLLGS